MTQKANDGTDIALVDGGTADPDWDYNELWSQAHQARAELEKAIRYMAEIENATEESNKTLMSSLEIVGDRVARAIDLLKP